MRIVDRRMNVSLRNEDGCAICDCNDNTGLRRLEIAESGSVVIQGLGDGEWWSPAPACRHPSSAGSAMPAGDFHRVDRHGHVEQLPDGLR